MLLSDEDIANRAAAVRAAATQRLADHALGEAQRMEAYHYIHPLADTCQVILESIATEERFTLGLAAIDTRTRGFGPKELVLVTGFAHSGKTQLINTAILNNRDRRILFFSLDDSAEMILLKLVCMLQDVDAETLERRIREGDEKSKHALHEAATLTFENLIVVDDSLDLSAMTKAIEEATNYWGAPPECVIIDYLGSMQGGDAGEDGGIKSKVASLKAWVKDKPFPTVVIHQNTRSRGAPGEPITLLSGGYGGEQEATILIGVRRKRDAADLDEWQRDRYRNTVTIHVVKNKRPPGKTTPPDGIDFYLSPTTGLIRPLHDDDQPVQRHGLTSAEDGMRARDAS